ncbi:uncharacterized protein LOC112568645 [Pomacea canaliculata]|uniref:uncharacterized protein LOC112568645 n=1 Tax=Pomacea canaliculata TaxID=400727 RepID=UPI000D73E4E4|nr:uncharacterized protein LOC112568645 [Pomacea canaliculata]
MVKFCLCLLTCLAWSSQVQGGRTACRALSVPEGETTNLTCFFSEDVSKSRKGFTVLHINGKERPNPVVDCIWVIGVLECATEAAYVFDKVVASSMTVQIPRVSTNETGKYTCQITGSKSEDLESCELLLSAGRTTCDVQSSQPVEETTLTCYFPEDIGKSKRDFAVHHFNETGTSALVIDCAWVLGNLYCSKHPGYELDSSVSNRFVARIPRSLAGRYLCEVSGARLHHASLCSVGPPEDRRDLSGCDSRALTAAVIFLVVVIIVMIGIFIFLILQHLKRRKAPPSQSTSNCSCKALLERQRPEQNGAVV